MSDSSRTSKSGDCVQILSCHGVGQPGRSISDSERRHWLRQDQLELFLELAERRGDIRLTFDDGNESDFTVVLPALLRRRLDAGFFVTTNLLDQQGYLSCSQVRELVQAGMAVGSHGRQHVSFRVLSTDALHEDLRASRSVLEELVGKPVTSLALPFGQYDRRVLSCVRASGYETVLTTDRGPTRSTAWIKARTTVYADDNVESFERNLLRELRPVPTAIRKIKGLIKRLR